MNEQINNTFIPTEGLVGKWDLDGNAIDSSGNGNDGTATNVVWVESEKGYVSECAQGNGSSSYISTTSTLLGIANTHSCFITVKSTFSTTQYPFVIRNYNTDINNIIQIIFDTASGKVLFDLYNSSGTRFKRYQTSLSFPTNGEYITIGYNWDGTDFKIYWNNKEDVNVTKITDNAGIMTDTSRKVWFLSNVGVNSFLSGNMGLVRVYNRVLTQQERTALHQEAQRKLGPLTYTPSTTTNHTFKKYSLPELNRGKVLEYSSPAVGGVYYNETGNGNNGTNNNIVDSTVGAYNLQTYNGTNAEIIIPDNNSLDFTTGFSFSVLLKPDAYPNPGTFQSLICKYDNWAGAGGYDFRIANISGNQRLDIAYASDNDSGELLAVNYTLDITKNNWITAEYDGSKLYLYVNGVEIGNTAVTLSLGTNTKDLYIGSFGTYTPSGAHIGRWYKGGILKTILLPFPLGEELLQKQVYSNFIPNN